MRSVLVLVFATLAVTALQAHTRSHSHHRARGGEVLSAAALDEELTAAIEHDMAAAARAAADGNANAATTTTAVAHELELNTASVLALEMHAAVHDAAAAGAAAGVSAQSQAQAEASAAASASASATATAQAQARYELLYPCYVCTRALNAFVAQYQALVAHAIRSGVPVSMQPKWNRTGICPQLQTNIVRPKDYGPCLRYENGVCLKRFGRPGIIALPQRPDAAAEGEGKLDNPFTHVFGERPQPNVTIVNAPGHGNSTVPVPMGNDTWCESVVDDLVSDPMALTKVFKMGCTVFPGLSLDDHWFAGGGASVPPRSSLEQQYYPKADLEVGCRMRDACSCLSRKGKPNIPYCANADPTLFDALAYWSEPDDLYERRRKALSQRRQCVRIGPANPPPPQPKLPPVRPPGADAPKLVVGRDGRPRLVPTAPVPAWAPGQFSQANARKLAANRSDAAKRDRKLAEEKEAKKQIAAAKRHQKERKAGVKQGPVTHHAPN